MYTHGLATLISAGLHDISIVDVFWVRTRTITRIQLSKSAVLSVLFNTAKQSMLLIISYGDNL